MLEQDIQNLIRLDASTKGARLFRNNSGVLMNSRGTPVRFGLGNDSPAVNRNLKSSDLIGIRPLVITPKHVDTLIGVFTSIEVKSPGRRRDPGQQNWINLIKRFGGFAGFATSIEEAKEIMSYG